MNCPAGCSLLSPTLFALLIISRLPPQRNLEHAEVICGAFCFWEMGAYTAQKEQHLPTQTVLLRY